MYAQRRTDWRTLERRARTASLSSDPEGVTWFLGREDWGIESRNGQWRIVAANVY
jgi:hypothetical protein